MQDQLGFCQDSQLPFLRVKSLGSILAPWALLRSRLGSQSPHIPRASCSPTQTLQEQPTHVCLAKDQLWCDASVGSVHPSIQGYPVPAGCESPCGERAWGPSLVLGTHQTQLSGLSRSWIWPLQPNPIRLWLCSSLWLQRQWLQHPPGMLCWSSGKGFSWSYCFLSHIFEHKSKPEAQQRDFLLALHLSVHPLPLSGPSASLACPTSVTLTWRASSIFFPSLNLLDHQVMTISSKHWLHLLP